MSWFLDGVDLSTLAWNIKNRSAGWSVPGKTGENIRVPGRHGTFWTADKTFEEGHLSLSMWAAGTNDDGTLPDSEDGRKKVRDNLDKLTSMFANSRRLLNLRQVTGSDIALVNEITNPTLTTSANTGYTLATNNVIDADRTLTAATEVSRNVSVNPYFKGRATTEEVITEDLYPDPGLRQHQNDAAERMMTGYYYPINQDAASLNQFFKGYNGFSLATGVNGGRGAFKLGSAVTWAGDANIGDLGREVWVNRADGVAFFINLKIAAAAPTSSVNLRVTPMVSADGVTWTNGTELNTVVTKTDYSWVIVPATSLPAMAPGTKFFVQYRLRIVGGSSWGVGDAFDIQYIALQDSPKVGNPWRSAPTPSMIIIGGETPYIWTSGAPAISWSEFRRPPAPEWEVVNTGAQATTAPYAFPWSGYDTTLGEGWLAFTVFGGTKNTFRRVLPVAQKSFTSTKIWGKCWTKSLGITTVRVTERTGSPGSYVYTPVGTVNIQSAESFASAPFTINAGRTYCLEVDVPTSDEGLEPAIFFRELHVSNALVNTLIPAGAVSTSWGTSSRAYFTGTVYSSSILGASYKPYGFTKGAVSQDMRRYDSTLTGWDLEDTEAYTQDGSLDMGAVSFNFTGSLESVTVRVRAALGKLSHTQTIGNYPTTGSATVELKLLNSSGATLRTLNYTMTNLSTQWTDYTYTGTLNAGEVGASVRILYSDGAYPLSLLKVKQLHVMVNNPIDVDFFTGSEISSDSSWLRTAEWSGRPYFSASKLTAPLPTSWTIDGFTGFDSDNRTIRFTGSTVRVPINASAGTAYVGYRRGVHTADMLIKAQPEGAGSPTTLGTITSTVAHAQANVVIPANATYMDFIITGGGTHKTVKDVFVMGSWEPAFPIPSTGWVGFYPNSVPTLVLPTHPSSQFPMTRLVKHANGTLSYTTGDVPGWDGPVLSGGYLQVPPSGSTHSIISNVVSVTGGYVSAAVLLQPAADAANKIKIMVQGATVAEYEESIWTTLNTFTVSSTSYQEIKRVDVEVGTKRRIRLVIEGSNVTTPLSRSGILGIVDGVALTPSTTPLGSNFPGYFLGVRASNGTSTYQGDVRQCFVEVTEALDMESLALGTIAEFNVNMVVPGAFWEDVYDISTTLTANGGMTSGVFYVNAFEGATAPMNDLVFDIQPVSGTLTKFKLTDAASGNFVEYNGPARTKVTVNTSLSTVTDESGNSVIRYVPSMGTSTILSLTPYHRAAGESRANHVNGTPILEWSANVPIKVVITGRRKYLIG